MMDTKEIISRLPYAKPFLFVDEIWHIDNDGVEGCYTFDETADFYKGHFKDHPVTPGVILTEVMAQIGLVCLGIYLLDYTLNIEATIALTSTDIEFLKPVYPNEKVVVISKKNYFRFGKLKCTVVMKNTNGENIASGTIAGIITSKKQ
jgi:3-hydroxyacyl-[acyl-carrier-protein] dehydratase